MTRMIRILLACLGCFAAALGYAHRNSVAAPSPGLADATILIVRHAEKPESGPGLAPAGLARARAYPAFFGRLRLDGGPVHVDELVATADSPQSARTRLTLTPLARAMRLPIRNAFANADVAGLAAWLAGHAAHRTVLIAWHHGEIPALIGHLGADPAALLTLGRWPADMYDQMVVIRYDAHGQVIPDRTQVVREGIAV